MKRHLITIFIALLLFSGLALWRLSDLSQAVLAACGSWVAGASAPTTRSFVDGVEINGLLYVFGNGGGLDVYNTVANTWATRAAMPGARVRSRISSAVIDGKLYVVGGQYDIFNYSNFLDVYDPATDAWTTRANMPTARCDAVVGVINGKLYVASGQDIGYRNNLEVYDPATNTWAAKAPIPVALSHSKGAAIDNKLYVPGGGIFDGRAVRPQNYLQIYDAVTDTWTLGPVMPTARFNPAATVRDGRLHVLGGSNDPLQNHALQTHEVYDPVTGTWTSRALMPSFRELFGAATIGGKIYAAYGHDFVSEFNRLEIYSEPDPTLWLGKAALPAARSSHTATSVNGRIYVTGGFLNTTQTNALGIYNPVNNTWRVGANMPTARSDHGAAAINGKLYVVGGSTIGVGVRNVLEIYDPVANTWANGANLPAPRTGMAVAAWNSKLYVVGGSNSSGTVENKLEIYDPVSNTWTIGTGMPTARQFAVAGFIHGKLYVVGGENGGTKSNKLEVYDPAVNTWTTGASIPVARSWSAAAVLHGRLHVLGGDAGFTLSARHDVYDPISNTWTTPTDVPVARSAFAAVEANGGIYAIGGHDGANVISRMDAWLAASDLSLTKTHTGQFTVGTPGDYTLTVSNAANAGCASGPVYVVDTLPAGLSYNSVIGAGWTCTVSGQIVACVNDSLSLGPGESSSFTLRVNVDSHGQGTNLAELFFSPDDGTSGNNAANDPTVMCPAFTIGTPAATTFLGQNYNSTVAATPAAPPSYAYRYALVNGTTLPPGLSLDAVTGAITGVATAGGVFTFDVRVSVVNATTLATLCSVTQTSTITACTNSPVVSNLNDSGPGSLREAILSVCAGSVISFAPGLTGTIQLASPLPDIARNLTINGPGAHLITVRRNTGGDYRIINIPGTGRNVTISGLTISNGRVVDAHGGGIFSNSNLTLTDCAITGNTTTGGTAGGGVYLVDADGLFTGCTFSGNTAGAEGGGLEFRANGGDHQLKMVNCTVSGNTSNGDIGSGVLNKRVSNASGAPNGSSTLDIINCTIAGNISPGGGGASVTTSIDTISSRRSVATRFRNTIISHNGSPSLSLIGIRSVVTSLGNNLATDGASGLLNQASDKINTNPQLDVLGNYGGPTQTYALLSGSPAANAGANCVTTNNCADAINLGFNLTTDQRGAGFARMSGSAVDIGAFEAIPCSTITATLGGGGAVCATQSANLTVAVSGGIAPYTVTLTNGGGTQTGNGPTFTFNVSPGTTTSYQVATGSKDANGCALTNSGTATVTVSKLPTTANAGPDQTVCSTSTTLAANTATVGAGAWSIISGAGGSFVNAASPTTAFNGTAGATYTLRWTISNAPCTSSTDDVVISFKANPTTANAGPDLGYCNLVAPMMGNTPSVGTGTWSKVSGPGTVTFAAVNSPTSNATASVAGVYTLRWTISNSSCTSSSDDVVITFNTPPTLSYASASVGLGAATTISPATGPGGAFSITSIVVQNPGTYTGTISVNNTSGVVSISNAAPLGTHTITIRVTNNCNVSIDATIILTVNQCVINGLTPSGNNVSAASGTSSFNVTGPLCRWTATSNASWLTLTGATVGTGNGTVTYNIAANTGTSRIGTISVNGVTHTVFQATADTTQDSDGDGIPDSVEITESRDPQVKDNDIFTNNRLFVMQQYRDFLGREGDPGGITNWVNALNSNTLTKAQVIESFFNSAEFQNTRAPIVRLYFAYFLRIPDYAGLQNWINAYRGGMTLDAISNAFAGSAEFIQTYGSLNNTQFVTLVYNNVLGRAPDQAGLTNWVNALNNGMSRGTMMLGFSESQEYRNRSGNWVYVTMMYVGMLRRAPEQAGFDNWVAYLNAGNSGLDLINGFIGAQEYRNRFLP